MPLSDWMAPSTSASWPCRSASTGPWAAVQDRFQAPWARGSDLGSDLGSDSGSDHMPEMQSRWLYVYEALYITKRGRSSVLVVDLPLTDTL